MRRQGVPCGGDSLNESALYKELGILTRDRERWKESIAYVSSLLTHASVKIQAKAVWLLGEMGLTYPAEVRDAVPVIVAFLNSPTPLLRTRAVNALGRIGRGSYQGGRAGINNRDCRQDPEKMMGIYTVDEADYVFLIMFF